MERQFGTKELLATYAVLGLLFEAVRWRARIRLTQRSRCGRGSSRFLPRHDGLDERAHRRAQQKIWSIVNGIVSAGRCRR